MFFFLPVGHDRTPPGFPIATAVLLVVNLAVFLVSHPAERNAAERADAALAEALDLYLGYGDRVCVWDEVYDELSRPLQMTGLFTPCRWSSSPNTAANDAMSELAIEAERALASRPNRRWGFTPREPSLLTAFTSMFLHGDVLHIFGNLLFLFLAGPVIEAFWRPLRYVAFYVLAGLAATGAHYLSTPDDFLPLVGASGAIAGLLGAFLVAHPGARVRLLGVLWVVVRVFTKVFSVPAWVVLPGWAAMQVYYATSIPDAPVAYWAHVGGFAFGALAGLVARRLRWGEAGPTWADVERERKPKSRQGSQTVTAARAAPTLAARPLRPEGPVAMPPTRVATGPSARVPSGAAPRLGPAMRAAPSRTAGPPPTGSGHPWEAARVELGDDGLRCSLPAGAVALRWESLSVAVVRCAARPGQKRTPFLDLVGPPEGASYPPPVRITGRTAVNYAALPGGSERGVEAHLRALVRYAMQRRPGLHIDAATMHFLAGEPAADLSPEQLAAYEAGFGAGAAP